MKIQCSCGVKYSFDISPEMVANPIRFVCTQCGLDSSAAVNELIRKELNSETIPTVETAPQPIVSSLPVASVSVAGTGIASVRSPIRVATAPKVAESDPQQAPAGADSGQPGAVRCAKHLDIPAVDECRVCHKPICPQCMELFGHVCSAYCQGRAESLRLDLPVFAGQKSVVEAKHWRRMRVVAWSAAAAIVFFVAAWGWYAWVGSTPRPIYSAALPKKIREGQCRFGPPHDVLVLAGGRLSRHDWKAKQQVWAVDLLDHSQFQSRAAMEAIRRKAAFEELKKHPPEDFEPRQWREPNVEEIAADLEHDAAGALSLGGTGSDVWVVSPEKITQYDWSNGQKKTDLPLSANVGRIDARPDTLFAFAGGPGTSWKRVTRVDLASGRAQTDELPATPTPLAGKTSIPGSRGTGKARPARDAPIGKDQIDRLSGIGPIALAQAVVVTAQARDEKMARMMKEDEQDAGGAASRRDAESIRWLGAGKNAVEFRVRLLEEKTEQRPAMKAPPKKSALEGTVNQAATVAIANEILNDMQRDRTDGGVEKVDMSRYQVTLRRVPADGAPDWSGEVTGSPQFFALDTADLLVAGVRLFVFDKSNRKVWESKLNYPIAANFAAVDWGGAGSRREASPAPAVERNGTLYFFDQAVLAAFDLATGNVRWRVPTVGVSDLHFDGLGALYANTTSASPESVKYSLQIDMSQKTHNVILKLEESGGRKLWEVQNRGQVQWASGKFVYGVESHPGEDLGPMSAGLDQPAHVRIYRLDAKSGRTLWEHYQPRFPRDIDFHDNVIHLLFANEIQVERFLSF